MTVPDLTLDVSGYCPQDRQQAVFTGGRWYCPACLTVWDADGSNGRQAGRAPCITDRPIDSTSPTVLDQPQPE